MEAKGIVWLAVSSKKQTDNVSLGEQLRQGLFHAAQRRVGVVGVLIVPGKSHSQRQERIDDISTHALRYLSMDDVRTGNAWLRDRFQITVESKRVTDVDILF
jgi:hypothetical protein